MLCSILVLLPIPECELYLPHIQKEEEVTDEAWYDAGSDGATLGFSLKCLRRA